MAAQKGVLSLKVLLVDTGKSSVMKFMGFMSVAEVCQDIISKTGSGGADHAIFMPDPGVGANRTGRWLEDAKTLDFYDLKNGDQLHFKKKHRPMKVKLPDGSIRAIMLDESLPVFKLVENVGEKIDLTHSEEYSFRIEGQSRWLAESQNLAGNAVPDDAILELRRKYWFSDANVTLESPMELHLLYVEASQCVLDGSLPVERSEAVEFAALLLQIQYKNYDPEKTAQKGWLDAAKYLPKEFHKKKKLAELEKDVRKSWMKLAKTSDLHAKFRFVQLARSLSTWGITHYLVQEKVVAGRNGQRTEWKDVRLGITRTSILVMDAETCKVLKKWEMTEVKRWAGGPRTFTLDFGDREAEYYIVQTLESDAICAQINGYINIILKRLKQAPKITADSQSRTPEIVNLTPNHGIAVVAHNITRARGGLPVYGADGSLMDPSGNSLGYGYGPGGQGFLCDGDMSAAGGLALDGSSGLTDLNSAISGIDNFVAHLGLPGGTFNLNDMSLEGIMQSFEESFVGAQRAAYLIADGAYSGQPLDHLACDLATNIGAMINAAKLAAAKGDTNVSLLPGAHALSEAVIRTLQCARQVQINPGDVAARFALAAARESMECSTLALRAQKGMLVADPKTSKLVLASALAVAKASQNLRNLAANEAGDDPQGIMYADLVDVRGEAVSFAARSLAGCIHLPEAQELVISSVATLKKQCGELILCFKSQNHPHSTLVKIGAYAKTVNDTLNALLDASMVGADDVMEGLSFNADAQKIKTHCAYLQTPGIGQDQLVSSYLEVFPAASQLISSSSSLVEKSAPVLASALLGVQMEMHGALGQIRTGIEGLGSDPHNLGFRSLVASEADKLGSSASRLAADAERRLVVVRMRNAAKTAALESIALSNSASLIPNPTEDPQFASLLNAVHSEVTKMIHALKENTVNPVDRATEKQLIESARQTAATSSALVAIAKKNFPLVESPEMRQALEELTDRVMQSLNQLLAACNALEDLGGGKQVREAIEALNGAIAEIESAEISSQAGLLTALPGQNANGSLQLLEFATNQVLQALAAFSNTAKSNAEEIGGAATQLSETLSQTTNAGTTTARTARDKNMQQTVLLAAKNIAEVGQQCLTAGFETTLHPENDRTVSNFDNSLRSVRDSLAALLNAAKGLDINGLNAILEALRVQAQLVQLGRGTVTDFDTAAVSLRNDGEALQAALANLCAIAGVNPRGLVPAAKMVASTVESFVRNLNNAATSAKETSVAEKIVNCGLAIVKETGLTVSASQVAASEGNSKAEPLVNSQNNVNLAIQDLLGVLSPGQAALEESLRRVRAATELLQSGSTQTPVDNALHQIDEQCKQIARATAELLEPGIVASDLGQRSKQLATLIEEMAKIALSVPGQQGSGASSSSGQTSGANPRVVTKLQEVMRAADQIIAEPSNCVDPVRIASSCLQELITDPTVTNKDIIKPIGDAVGQLLLAVKDYRAGTSTEAQVLAKAKLLKAKLGPLLRDMTSNSAVAGGTPLLSETTMTTNAATDLLEASLGVLRNPRNRQSLSAAAAALSTGIDQLTRTVAMMHPGAADTARTVAALEAANLALDQLRFAPKTAPTKSLQACQEEIHTACLHLNSQASSLVDGTLRLDGQTMSIASQYIAQLATSLTQVTAEWIQTGAGDRDGSINLTKGIVETLLECVRNAQAVAASPTEQNRQELSATSQTLHSALSAIITKMQGGVVGVAECDAALLTLTTCLQSLSTPLESGTTAVYKKVRDQTEARTNTAGELVARLSTSAQTKVSQIGVAAKSVETAMPSLFSQIKLAANVSTVPGAKQHFLHAAQTYAQAVASLLQAAKSVASEGHATTPKLQTDVSQAFAQTTQATVHLRNLLEECDANKKAVDGVLEEFSKLLANIEASSLNATGKGIATGPDAGLERSYANLVRRCKNLTGVATKFCSTARTDEEAMPVQSKLLLKAVDELLQSTHALASQTFDKFSQQGIYNAMKSVNTAAKQLVEFASGGLDGSSNALADPAMLLADSISKLVDTSRLVASHILAGGAALNQGKQQILESLIQHKNPTFRGSQTAKPEDIQTAARELAKFSGTVSSCLNSPEELATAATGCASAVQSLVSSGKGCCRLTPDGSIIAGVVDNVESISRSTYGLLSVAQKHQGAMDSQSQRAVAASAEKISESLIDLLNAARLLPGGANLELESDDLAKTAQGELAAAAAKIADATKRLMAITPPPPTPGNKFQAEIHAAILDAVKAVMMATSTLIRSATDVQNELVLQGRTSPAANPYRRDPAWARGLISAAFAVADTTDQLVNSTNDTVRGSGGLEGVVASVRMVGGATARLVTASRVKADPNSPSQQKLEQASRDVTQATSDLANAAKTMAQRAAENEAASSSSASSGSAKRIAEEFQKQKEIAELEERLERARAKLGASRRAQYARK